MTTVSVECPMNHHNLPLVRIFPIAPYFQIPPEEREREVVCVTNRHNMKSIGGHKQQIDVYGYITQWSISTSADSNLIKFVTIIIAHRLAFPVNGNDLCVGDCVAV